MCLRLVGNCPNSDSGYFDPVHLFPVGLFAFFAYTYCIVFDKKLTVPPSTTLYVEKVGNGLLPDNPLSTRVLYLCLINVQLAFDGMRHFITGTLPQLTNQLSGQVDRSLQRVFIQIDS